MEASVIVTFLRASFQFAARCMFMFGVFSALNVLLWAWLAFLLAAIISVFSQEHIDKASAFAYDKSVDAAAWCVRKFRSFNAPKVAA